jgi:hypothetical protein
MNGKLRRLYTPSLPPPNGHPGPNGLKNSERPRTLEKPIDRAERTCASESQNEPVASVLERVEDQHRCDGKQPKGRKDIHFKPSVFCWWRRSVPEDF